MSRILGYIVAPKDLRYGWPAKLGEFNVLWFDDEATVFPTRQTALNAVKRSRTFAKKRGFDWNWWDANPRLIKVITP